MADNNINVYKKSGLSLWFAENWRSLSFLTYMTICLFDFIIMPMVFQTFNQHIDVETLTRLALQFHDPEAQRQLIQTFGTKLVWTPLTLQGSGTFHVAFGAILTAAGYTRGQEKIATIQAISSAPAATPSAPTPVPAPAAPPAPVPTPPGP